jgi:hypothetical protein
MSTIPGTTCSRRGAWARTLIQRDSCARTVECDERPTSVKGRAGGREVLLSRAVVASDVEDGGERSAARRHEQISGGVAVKHHAGRVQQWERLAKGLDARGVANLKLRRIEVVAVPEERLAIVLGGPQVAAAGTHRVTCCERGVGLLHKLLGERRPLLVPAVAVARRDLDRDVQALAYVRHARVALPDRSLELAVEVLIIEVQLHVTPLRYEKSLVTVTDARDRGSSGRDARVRRTMSDCGVRPSRRYTYTVE